MRILFFNHFHNGDLFTSKSFINQIIQHVGRENCSYCHPNYPAVLADVIDKNHNQVQNQYKRSKFMEVPGVLMINTWVGAYEEDAIFSGKINLQVLCQIWGIIFDKINDYFNLNLKLKPSPDDYIPETDYSQYHCSPANKYIGQKNTLICNNHVCSNQSNLPGDMQPTIERLSSEFPDTNFFCTQKVSITKPNVIFTDDLFSHTSPDGLRYREFWQRLCRCDLNEISFLGSHCSTIIGRNSGPFIFCLTKNNISDPSKTIISFNNQEEDSLLFGIDHECKYKFSSTESEEDALNIILPLCKT